MPVQKWNREARERALQQARAMAERDPDAAEQLLKQLQVEEQAAAQEKPDPMAQVLHEAYDPLELYLRIAKVYGWTLDTIDQMDYVMFFVSVEKTKKLLDEESRAYSNPTQDNQVVTEREVQAWLPPVREYSGPTVAFR